LNEVGNPKWNKVVIACFTLFTGIGMLTGLNLAIPYRHHWKILFEYGFVPIGLQILLMCFLPESQSYYINKNSEEEALEVLKKGLDDKDAKFELARLRYEKQFFVSSKVGMGRKYSDLFSVYTKPLFICLGLAFFGQAVGTSAFLYYGAEIFYETQADVDGIEERQESAIILDDFVLGAFVIGNLISAFVIYKAGRKMMMLIALPFAFVSLLLLAYTMKETNYGDEEDPDEGAK
jgi:MFS family permease